jgi:magnesium transporter
MKREININGIKWIDGVDLGREEVYKILKNYDFHELDLEAAMEENQRARIDSYDNYFFVILHFPKYNPKTKAYELNEFNIFVWKDFLITLRNYHWTHVNAIFKKYSELVGEEDISVKVSSGFILYEIIQSMLEKMFKVVENIRLDFRHLEKQVFDNISSPLVKDIMIKKRNVFVLKNMFKPQVLVMNSLENSVNQLFQWSMELYFEDLEDKLRYVVNDIIIMEEQINAIEDAFSTIINIKTSYVISILTIFSAFILPLTLITSFYGMNIKLPFQDDSWFVYLVLLLSVVSMSIMHFILKKMGKM